MAEDGLFGSVDLDKLARDYPQFGLARRWHETFGQPLPTVGQLAPADLEVLEEALEASDPEVWWDHIRAELDAGKIR